MKILLLANNDIGLYKFRRELLEELVNNGHQVFVSVPDGEFIPEIKALGCKVLLTDISRHGTNPLEDFILLKKYKSMIKELKPDIVFTYTIKPNIYGGMACAWLKTSYVVNITGLGTAVENKGILQFITINLYRYALRKVQTIFFQNLENKHFFENRKIGIGKHKMLPGSGVNLEYYTPIHYPESDSIEFVFVARIMKEKGIDQYLDAAETIKRRHPQTKFHICGFIEQAYEDKIKEFQDKNIIVYHGVVKDMRDIYAHVHCVVHPTFYPEGLSNVLLEAAASARPIITTNRSGCREVIEDGINGFLVKEQDSGDLIEKIEKFISITNGERKKMGIAGREKVRKEFDRKIVINKYLKELENLR